MEHIKTIIVPLAFADYSSAILEYTAQLIKKTDNSNITVLNVINSNNIESIERIIAMGYKIDTDHYVDDIKKDRIEQFEQMVRKSGIDKNRIKLVFKIGNPVDEVLKFIKEQMPDLVVMGTKGRTGLRYTFTGSVAEKVFKRSPVNVLSFR